MSDAPCGTTAGNARHYTRREDPCQPCRQAKIDYMRQYRATQPAKTPNHETIAALVAGRKVRASQDERRAAAQILSRNGRTQKEIAGQLEMSLTTVKRARALMRAEALEEPVVNDQRSTREQLGDAVSILNRRGLYEAADFCKREVDRIDEALATRAREWAAVKDAESQEPRPAAACPDGFHWIGQAFWSCDRCGLPAWQHAGMAELPAGAGPFGVEPFVLRPWRDGEAEAIRAKWEPGMKARSAVR